MSDLSSPFSVIWRERFFIHLTVSPSLFSFLWLILVSLSKSCFSTCSIWADDLCLSAHSLASVVLPLMQLLEFINRKNSVILKVCIRRPMSGIPARQQVASILINLVIVLVMFAVAASLTHLIGNPIGKE